MSHSLVELKYFADSLKWPRSKQEAVQTRATLQNIAMLCRVCRASIQTEFPGKERKPKQTAKTAETAEVSEIVEPASPQEDTKA